MFKKRDRNEIRVIRHARVRKKISGTPEVPRLSVYRSNKYIYAQVGDEEPITVPFAAGSSWYGHPTVIHGVKVGEDQTLTIGVIEHYISGQASGHDYAPTDWWNTNTFAGEARMYLVAPYPEYDYATAAVGIQNVNTVSKAPVSTIYSVSGTRLGQMQKGVNIVKRADGSVSKVLVK